MISFVSQPAELLHVVELKNQHCEVFYDKLKFIYSVYRSYEVQYYLRLIPCLDPAHPSSLFPILSSLFPVTRSAVP
ncbi:MAG: hypothetical protein F6K26_40635 [Moorea sp. SIO2I5]|nr:hypothetical protein [Moorena sp. SIO2I5]